MKLYSLCLMALFFISGTAGLGKGGSRPLGQNQNKMPTSSDITRLGSTNEQSKPVVELPKLPKTQPRPVRPRPNDLTKLIKESRWKMTDERATTELPTITYKLVKAVHRLDGTTDNTLLTDASDGTTVEANQWYGFWTDQATPCYGYYFWLSDIVIGKEVTYWQHPFICFIANDGKLYENFSVSWDFWLELQLVQAPKVGPSKGDFISDAFREGLQKEQ